ncbi:cupin domain-containing protein [Streptomyces sp. NPDC050287]|uniref:cupin domain-containing protein n=1 Tax=Streptomyces sp. NPDC050287 TaxID=3365608 RepID=UPI0037A91E42
MPNPSSAAPVLTALARPIHVAARENPQFQRTVELLIAELAQPQIGTTAAVNRRVGLLLVQFVRAWLARHPQGQPGSWLGVMRNPVVRAALTCVHSEPERPWTTETPAAEIRVCRATLSRHFRDALGQTPGTYVTQWRMDLASLRLRDTGEPSSRYPAPSDTAPRTPSAAPAACPPGEYRSRSRDQGFGKVS